MGGRIVRKSGVNAEFRARLSIVSLSTQSSAYSRSASVQRHRSLIVPVKSFVYYERAITGAFVIHFSRFRDKIEL